MLTTYIKLFKRLTFKAGFTLPIINRIMPPNINHLFWYLFLKFSCYLNSNIHLSQIEQQIQFSSSIFPTKVFLFSTLGRDFWREEKESCRETSSQLLALTFSWSLESVSRLISRKSQGNLMVWCHERLQSISRRYSIPYSIT